MYKILKYSAVIILLFSTSCKKNLPTIGGTTAQKMANEWWVTFTADGEDIYGLGHVKISTYNTSANGNEIWVDDLHNAWNFKVKAQADLNNLSFNAATQKNEYYDITVDLKNGKIFPNAGHSKSGNVTDSIYMEAKFSDDSTTYVLSGTARTRLIEDEY